MQKTVYVLSSWPVKLTLLSPRLATYTMSSTSSTQVAVEPSFHAGFLPTQTSAQPLCSTVKNPAVTFSGSLTGWRPSSGSLRQSA